MLCPISESSTWAAELIDFMEDSWFIFSARNQFKKNNLKDPKDGNLEQRGHRVILSVSWVMKQLFHQMSQGTREGIHYSNRDKKSVSSSALKDESKVEWKSILNKDTVEPTKRWNDGFVVLS